MIADIADNDLIKILESFNIFERNRVPLEALCYSDVPSLFKR